MTTKQVSNRGLKLSEYAQRIGVSYHTARSHFKKGFIPGAYQLPTGTIVVPERALTELQNNGKPKME